MNVSIGNTRQKVPTSILTKSLHYYCCYTTNWTNYAIVNQLKNQPNKNVSPKKKKNQPNNSWPIMPWSTVKLVPNHTHS